MRQALAVLVLLIAAAPAAARVRPARAPHRILWIGAHPDDEILLSPLLGRDCVERGAACAMLVMTRGEAGGSAEVRAGELAASAAMLHATLTQWTFADVMADVDATWSAAAGGREALLDRIAAAIDAASPSVVYTFDPRHGSTCHPAHRAIGALVVEAMARRGIAAPLYFVETTSSFASAVADPIVIDAAPFWSYLVRDAQIHASQFPASQIETFATLPVEQRKVWLLDARSAPRAMYSVACP